VTFFTKKTGISLSYINIESSKKVAFHIPPHSFPHGAKIFFNRRHSVTRISRQALDAHVPRPRLSGAALATSRGPRRTGGTHPCSSHAHLGAVHGPRHRNRDHVQAEESGPPEQRLADGVPPRREEAVKAEDGAGVHGRTAWGVQWGGRRPPALRAGHPLNGRKAVEGVVRP
jgi:hypothetical protein